MKKYIAIVFLGLFFIITPVSAQTVTTTDPQTAYIQALQQVLDLLIKQVAELMKQLAEVQAQQNTINTKVDTVVQNTYQTPYATPYATPVSAGSVYQTPYATPAASVPSNATLNIESLKDCNINSSGVVTGNCQIEVVYKEGALRKYPSITISSKEGSPLTNTSGIFNYISNLGPYSIQSEIEDKKTYAQINYFLPLEFTATVNGLTKTNTFSLSSHYLYSTSTNSVIGNL